MSSHDVYICHVTPQTWLPSKNQCCCRGQEHQQQRNSLEMMEGWDKPPSHAWHLSRRWCHRDSLLCKWLTQPPEMQPDIQEDAIAPSAWSRETAARSSLGLYVLFFLSVRDIQHSSDRRLERVQARGHAAQTPTHMLLSYNAQTSPATHVATAGRQVSCERLLAAQERLKTRLLLSSVMDEGAMLVLVLTETQLNLLSSR